MRKILAVAFACSVFTGCTVGDDPVADDGDEHPDDMNPDPNPNPTGEGLSGTIASNMTLSGAVRVKGATTIPAGVIVTVAAGSTIDFVNGSNFIVQGTLKMEGTSAGKIIARAEAGSTGWNGFAVTGTLDVTYGDFIGGRIYTTGAAANLIITDTKMYQAGGDYIITDGGTINMTYSQVGAGPGETDSDALQLPHQCGVVDHGHEQQYQQRAVRPDDGGANGTSDQQLVWRRDEGRRRGRRRVRKLLERMVREGRADRRRRRLDHGDQPLADEALERRPAPVTHHATLHFSACRDWQAVFLGSSRRHLIRTIASRIDASSGGVGVSR
jgi:hypothetical protein